MIMNILFVCTGNTCRSPFAEGYLKQLNFPNISVFSAGLAAMRDAVSENSAKAAREYGFNIDNRISVPLNTDMLAAADIIYCMNQSAADVLKVYAPNGDIRVLGGGISDPYGGTPDTYRDMAREIKNAIDNEFIKISKADETDISDIFFIEKECFSTPWSENAIKESLEHGTLFFKAQVMGKTVGYMGISVVLDEGYITNIAILPEYRGRGIAKKIMLYAEDGLQDLKFISLEVRVSNTKAINLYEKLGFKQVGLRKRFYENPTEDALIYTKEF